MKISFIQDFWDVVKAVVKVNLNAYIIKEVRSTSSRFMLKILYCHFDQYAGKYLASQLSWLERGANSMQGYLHKSFFSITHDPLLIQWSNFHGQFLTFAFSRLDSRIALRIFSTFVYINYCRGFPRWLLCKHKDFSLHFIKRRMSEIIVLLVGSIFLNYFNI